MALKMSVLKKVTPNGKVVLYLRCRDYASVTEPIDGAVAVDLSYLKHRKVFGELVAHFRFGHEKDEVMGLKFHKDFILQLKQIYPPLPDSDELTDIQKSLKEKLVDMSVFPFTFYFPNEAPMSVSLFSKLENDPKASCGIHYYVKIWVSDSEFDIPHKRSTAILNIRRIQFAPLLPTENPPSCIVEHNFVACSGTIELEATLDKSIFENNENIAVNISLQNSSNKSIKKIRVILYQNVSIQMLQKGEYKCVMCERVSKKGCPIRPGSCMQCIIHVVPSLTENRMKDGIALNGQHKRQNYNLASSTFLHNRPVKEAFGIIVNYFIRVKLHLGKLNGVLFLDLPVILMPLKRVDDIAGDRIVLQRMV